MTDATATAVVTPLANALMRAVVNSRAIRSADQDAAVAVRVMREELKAFIAGEKYADERAIVLSGGSQHLAFQSLVAECISRIISERSA